MSHDGGEVSFYILTASPASTRTCVCATGSRILQCLLPAQPQCCHNNKWSENFYEMPHRSGRIFTPAPIGERSIVMSVFVCVCVCVCVCVSVRDHIFGTTRHSE